MKLGVSPAAASTPTSVSNQSFEALFTHPKTLGFVVCLAPQLFLPVYLHMNVGTPNPKSATSPRPPATSLPASCSLAYLGPPATALLRVLSAWPPSQPLPPVWMNVSSLTPCLSDFYTVQFSGSSACFLFLNLLLSFFGCAGRHSMSTYTSILARSPQFFLFEPNF